MAEPVRWGIAGFGWVARDFMAPAIAAAGHTLAAVCDPDPAARARAGSGVAAYAGIAELAADPAVEAIYVATPNHLHRAMVEAAAARGRAVLCEKPMAATLVDAEAIARACRKAGILYATAFDQRHHPAHRAMRDAIQRGVVGTVTAVRIVYACWLGGDWDQGTGPNWRIDAGMAGGGAVMDLAPHGIDLVDLLLGEPLVELQALLQRRVHDYAVDDGGLLVGRTASGVLASLHVAYNCPEGLPRRRLEVIGTTGQLTAIDTMGQEAGGSVSVTDGVTGLVTPLPVMDADTSPFVHQVRAFSAALREGRSGDPGLARDLHGMRLLDAVYRLAEAWPSRDQAAAPSRPRRAVPQPLS